MQYVHINLLERLHDPSHIVATKRLSKAWPWGCASLGTAENHFRPIHAENTSHSVVRHMEGYGLQDVSVVRRVFSS